MFSRRRKPSPAPLPVPHSMPALDEARNKLAEAISEVDRRIDAVLERLRAQEQEGQK